MMKTILMVSVGAILSSFTIAQNNDPIIQALKSANAGNLSRYFDNVLDMKLPDRDEVKNVGTKQAGILLQRFFDDNGVSGFQLLNQRSMGGTSYIAGKLEAKTKTYNITLMIRTQESNGSRIESVRIN